MEARCPSCTETSGTVVEKRVLDGGGLSVSFRCERCDERWTVVF